MPAEAFPRLSQDAAATARTILLEVAARPLRRLVDRHLILPLHFSDETFSISDGNVVRLSNRIQLRRKETRGLLRLLFVK